MSIDPCRHITGGPTLIAVPTGGRPAALRRLLEALTASYSSAGSVRLLVVDNDSRASGRATFDAYSPHWQGRARYVVESRRGYASARNAVLRHVGDAKSVAMIDDDEVPAAGWLENLIAAQLRTEADVVAGPVVSLFPPGLPAWLTNNEVFNRERPDHPEGSEILWCATNNTLVTGKALSLVPEGFDEKFNASSGEDTHFFLRARLRGARIVWTKTAAVQEYLPPARLRRNWVFRRGARNGNTRALVELELLRSRSMVAKRLMKACALVALGLCKGATAAISRDKGLVFTAAYDLGLGYGMLVAMRSDTPLVP